MLTRSRGNDRGNWLAMAMGFTVVALLSDLPNNLIRVFGGTPYPLPKWLPVLEFPWFILFGTVSTFLVAICFTTPPEAVAAACEGVVREAAEVPMT